MQAQVALDSFETLQTALPLSAGCVQSEAEEMGIETAFLGWVDPLSPAFGKVAAVSRLCLPSSLHFQTLCSCLRSSDIPDVSCHY